MFSAELDLDAAIEHYRYVKDAAAAHGRGRDAVRILPGLITTIGSSRAEAQRRYEEQNALLPAGHDVERLSQTLGADLSGLPLDEPIPARLLGSVPDPSKFVGSLGFGSRWCAWSSAAGSRCGRRCGRSAGRVTG